MLSAHVDENGNIDDAEKTWNPNEQWGGGGWITLYRTGTGENPCDCEACANGDNPAEWIPENNNDELDCVADRINDKLKEVGAEFAQAQFEREQCNGEAEKRKYIIQDREAGNIIDSLETEQDALNALAKYEADDKEEGNYMPDFYEIIEVEDGE